jgi:hypothetical protein
LQVLDGVTLDKLLIRTPAGPGIVKGSQPVRFIAKAPTAG